MVQEVDCAEVDLVTVQLLVHHTHAVHSLVHLEPVHHNQGWEQDWRPLLESDTLLLEHPRLEACHSQVLGSLPNDEQL